MVSVREILHVAALSLRRLSGENLLPVFSIPKSGDTKSHFEVKISVAQNNQNSL